MRWNASSENFRAEFSTLIHPHAADLIEEYRFVEIPANRPPWTATGIKLAAGDRVSLFCAGRAWLAATPLAWVGAHFGLWIRVGTQGPIFRPARGSCSFTATNSGELYLANIFPGAWADQAGALASSPDIFERVAGAFEVLVVRWRLDARQGLERLAGSGGPAAEMAGCGTSCFAKSDAPAIRVEIPVVGGRRRGLQRIRRKRDSLRDCRRCCDLAKNRARAAGAGRRGCDGRGKSISFPRLAPKIRSPIMTTLASRSSSTMVRISLTSGAAHWNLNAASLARFRPGATGRPILSFAAEPGNLGNGSTKSATSGGTTRGQWGRRHQGSSRYGSSPSASSSMGRGVASIAPSSWSTDEKLCA